MDLYAIVAPLVRSKETYELMYGEDDPEELAIMQLQDRQAAEQVDSVMFDLYGLQTHLAEPADEEGLEEMVGTLEDLHELRRIAADVHGKTVDDYQEGRVAAGAQFNHLINHADDSGYYLPVDFLQAFAIEEVSVGSAVALLKELEALEPVLTERYPIEVALAKATPDEEERADISGPVGVWHSLQRLCRSALELNLPIQFDG
jgi:hypothetical protein